MKLLEYIDTEKILPDSHCVDRMVFVEGGTFWMGYEMGDEGVGHKGEIPAHYVEVDSFYIGQFPVTQQLWKEVMGSNPSDFKGDLRPVENVSWEDTKVFFEKLNKMPGIQYTYRLPTEAEWEYAARGGRLSMGYQYAGSDVLDEVGWYGINSNDESWNVGLKLPNELGLYDMSGNVWEWCQDYYSDSYYLECYEEGEIMNPDELTIMNPKGPNDGEYFVLRGGSWGYNHPRHCRVWTRDWNQPNLRDFDIGFRCARYV